MRQTFEAYLKANPVVFPADWSKAEQKAGGIYEPVARLQRFWEWADKVCEALIAGRKVPHAIVAYYLENPYSKIYALPPSRRKDYPDLAAKYPICYELQADGTRKLV